jgi:VWFA-related protein
MTKPIKRLTLYLSLTGLISGTFPLHAESSEAPTNKIVSVIVTAADLRNSTPPLLTRDDVFVSQKREQLPVVDVTPLQNERAGLDLAVLFDDSQESDFSSQLGELAGFIRSLPPTTRVAVAYIRNSTFTMGQDFTTDHESAIKLLRVPLGSPGEFASPYLSLTDLIMAMPDNGNRRAILMISDGVDRFRGPLEAVSPDLEPAYQEAQRRGVLIYTIYATGVDRGRQDSIRTSYAQGSLAQLAEETGGEPVPQDLSTPVSLKPCLQELQERLEQQYLVSFQARPNGTGRYEHFRFTTDDPGVELIAPAHVYVSGGR